MNPSFHHSWCLLVVLALAGQGPALGAEGNPDETMMRLERQLFETMNRERSQNGLPALRMDPTLSRVAREHSVDMARQGAATHESTLPGQRTPEDRYQRAFGTSPAKLTENIAVIVPSGPDSTRASTAHTALNRAADSRRNLLDREVTMIGVGGAEGPDGRLWITALFALPAGRPVARVSPTAPETPASPPPSAERLEELLWKGINDERGRQIATGSLKLEPVLRQAAREHSADMERERKLSHASEIPGHQTPMERYEWVIGAPTDRLFEALAVVDTGPEESVVQEAMMALKNWRPGDSLSRRESWETEGFRHMIDRDYRFGGVGCVLGADGRFWVTAMYAMSPQNYLDYQGRLTPEFSETVYRFFDLESAARTDAIRMGKPVTKFEVKWRGQVIQRGDPLGIEMKVVRGEQGTTPNGWGGAVYVKLEIGDVNQRESAYGQLDFSIRGNQGKMTPDGTLTGSGNTRTTAMGTGSSWTEKNTPLTWEAVPTDPSRGVYELFVLSEGNRVQAGTFWRKGRSQTQVTAAPPAPAATPSPLQPTEPIETPVTVAEPEPSLTSEDENRAADIRWLHSIEDALTAAERRKIEARVKLIASKEIIRQWEQRIADLQQMLAAGRTPEAKGIVNEIVQMGVEVWDEVIMEAPRPLGADSQAVIQYQIDQLQQRIGDARKEQDEIIQQTLDTYYDTIDQELERRGPESTTEVRDLAKSARPEVRSLKGLAAAELYLAAGQDEKFEAAAQACISEGRHVPEARYLQGTYFLGKNDLRRALGSFRLVMDLTKPQEEAPARVTSREQAEALDENGDSLYQQARSTAWMLENAYLKAVDAKASLEAHQVQGEVEERTKKGGDEGTLGAILGFLSMGPTSAVSAQVGLEDSLVDLAAKYEKEVAAQHSGLLLMQSLHDRGFPLDAIDQLDNDEFLTLMRDYYGEAGAKLQPGDGVRLRAAVKAALRNPDVSKLVSGSKALLRVDSGQDYFDHATMALPGFDSASGSALRIVDEVSVANLVMMVMPMTTFRVSGKLAGVRYTGVLGEAEKAGATLQTAREGFLAATRLNQLPTMLEETRAGQAMMSRARQFVTGSGWTTRRGLEVATFLAAGKAGEGIGGTMGVISGTDGKTEAKAGRMLAEMFTMWTVGDVDALKETVEAHGITPAQLEAVVKKVESESTSAAELAATSERHAAAIQDVLPPEPGAGISAEGRQAAGKIKADIDQEVQAIRGDVARGRADAATFKRLAELGDNYMAAVALERGAEAEGREWLNRIQKISREGGAETVNHASVAQQVGEVKRQISEKIDPLQPLDPELPTDELVKAGMPSLRTGRSLTADLDQKWIENKHGEALAGYRERYALIQHLSLKNAPEVRAAQFPQKISALQSIVEKRAEIKAMARPEGVPHHLEPVTREEVEGLVARGEIRLEPIAADPLKASYSDPYWVYAKKDGAWAKIGVFKRSGREFQTGAARGQDLEAEEIYANFAQEFKELGIEVPACTRAKMNVETRVVTDVGGTKTLVEVRPPEFQDGVFVRWAPGEDLEKLGPLAPALFKKQIARDKVLAALFFDHDRKAGNYLVSDVDKLLSLDHSLASFRGFSGESLASDDEVARFMSHLVGHWRNRQVKPEGLYRLLDEQITIEDMTDTIGVLEEVFKNQPEKVRSILGRSMSAGEAEETVRILSARARVLRRVLEENFGTLKNLQPVPMRTTSTSLPGQRTNPFIGPGGAEALQFAA